jgi:hypothetical protein
MRHGKTPSFLVFSSALLVGMVVWSCAAVLGIDSTTVDPTLDQDSGFTPSDSEIPPQKDGDIVLPTPDAAEDGPPVDAGPQCDPTKPWNLPRPINELNTPTVVDIGGRLSEDELTVYIGRNNNILKATRMKIADPFGMLTPSEVNAPGATSGHFTSSSDGVRAYFASTGRPDSDGMDIYTTTRMTTALPWGTPSRVVGIPTNRQEDHPWLRYDGKALYWDANDNNSFDIWRGDVLPQNGVIINATVVPSLRTGANETSPVVTADDLTIYFSRSPGLVVHVAKRNLPTDNWGPATIVAELNAPTNQRVNWLSPDGCRMILYSERAGGGDLFVTEKPK